MRGLPFQSVDFKLTGPPYLMNYRDRCSINEAGNRGGHDSALYFC
jgi:hypothetical protein